VRWNKATWLAAAVFAVAGCASGTGTTTTPGTARAGPAATVSMKVVPGVGPSLVDSTGRTLYFADQEASGSIHCLAACVRFWIPLTTSSGSMPTAGDGVTGRLSTINRPDGMVQVTYDGKPLCTFIQDDAPGKATGNGFKDSFDGTDFEWHAAGLTGAAPSPIGSSASNGSDGYHY
jgi:predicted lipoprotein with Yx(FWY)xxD motif